jgi:hypothetical protein
MRSTEPGLVSKSYYKKFHPDSKSHLSSINRCPFFNGYLNNLYEVKSIYDYEFYLEDGAVKTNYYNDSFIDKHLVIRSMENKMFSFTQKYIFFTDSDSLLMNTYEAPIFEDNNITQNCYPLPGQVDIGKWFTNLEFPFHLKSDRFKVNLGEVMYYLKFHTNEKINFKQFMVNNNILKYLDYSRGYSSNTDIKKYTAEEFYDNFKIKKFIIDEINTLLIK